MPTRRPDEAAQTQVAPETPSLAPEQQASEVGETPWLMYDPEVSQVMHAATTQGWQPDQLRTALQGSKAFGEIQERRAALQDPERGEQSRAELAQEVAYMTGRQPADPLVMDMAGRLESGQATMAAIRGLVAPMEQGTPTSRVLELAKAHGIPMNQQSAAQWKQLPEAEIDGQLAQFSQAMYPWKPANLPYQQVAQVFADVKSRELGRRVDWDDPRLDDLMAQSQGQLAGFRQSVRELPEWAETDHAKELIQQRQDQVMHALLNGDADEDGLAANQQLIAGMQGISQPTEQPMTPSQAQGQTGPALAAPLIGPGRGEGQDIEFGGGRGGDQGVTVAAMDYVKNTYGLAQVGGYRAKGSVPGSDHPKGLAIDAMIGNDMAKGDAIAADFEQNAAQWGVKYIIWNRRINSMDGRGWRPYRGPSPHTDHPHISFTGEGGGGKVQGPGQAAGAASAPAPQPSPLGGYGLQDALSGGMDAALGGQQQQQAQSFGGPPVGGPSSSGDWRSSLSPAEQWIINRESSFRPEADNPTSTAFGLGQLLLANRIKYLGSDYNTTDPAKQLNAFRAYVRDRYGSAERAKSFWQSRGWY